MDPLESQEVLNYKLQKKGQSFENKDYHYLISDGEYVLLQL